MQKYIKLAMVIALEFLVLSCPSVQKDGIIPLLPYINIGESAYNASGDTWEIAAADFLGSKPGCIFYRQPVLIAFEISPFNLQVPNVDPTEDFSVHGNIWTFGDTRVQVLKTYLDPTEFVEKLLKSQGVDNMTIFNATKNSLPVVWGKGYSQTRHRLIYAAHAYSSVDNATLLILSTNPKILDSIRITSECSSKPLTDLQDIVILDPGVINSL